MTHTVIESWGCEHIGLTSTTVPSVSTTNPYTSLVDVQFITHSRGHRCGNNLQLTTSIAADAALTNRVVDEHHAASL